MKKKNKKINVENLILFIIFVICAGIVFGDFLFIFLNISKSIGFTKIGCFTFVIAMFFAGILYDYFFDNNDK